MGKQIVIIQGHPDPAGGHFGHALAAAYAEGAQAAGHRVEILDVARLEFGWLTSQEAFERGEPPPAILSAQQAIRRADHLVFLYPLWLGDMPAILKAFLEQTFRPAFITTGKTLAGPGRRLLKGKTAHIIITMGMPGLAYRLFYRAHSLKSFQRNILKFCGIRPVASTLVGMAGGNEKARRKWLQRMSETGKKAR